MKENKKNKRSNDASNDKVSLEYNLEIERQDESDDFKKGYDFVPRDYHWTDITEQKLKVEEIENKTKNVKEK